uniref:FANCI_HD2 domain-containing protein n=1 Tax=Syphacia muris TaxID=451379 RepID=A0A158R4A9_9BILA
MSLPTQQLSQTSRTKRHENFCTCFCAQVEKNASSGNQLNSSYVEQASKLFLQLEDDTRWKNLSAFLINKSNSDRGELFNRFSNNWFTALDDIGVEHKELHLMRMLRLIMDVFEVEVLDADPIVGLHSLFVKQFKKLEITNIQSLCMYVLEQLLQGKSLPNRWIGLSSTMLQEVAKIDSCNFMYKAKHCSGSEFSHHFLLQCFNDVVASDSISILATLVKECGMQDVIFEFVTESLKVAVLEHSLCIKLVVLLSEIPNELAEQVCEFLLQEVNFSLSDLVPICALLHTSLLSNAVVSRTVFNIVKRERNLITTRVFPLLCLLCLTNTPRFHANALIEIKQNIVKLWKNSNKIKESAWVRIAVGKYDMTIMQENLEKIIDSVTKNQAWNSVLGSALQDLSLSLLTEKNSTIVKIKDGRVDDDSGLFALGKRLLIAIADSYQGDLGELLDQIFLSISKVPSSGSALYLIDVVVDIVMQHTIQVLNSWKSLRHLVDTICSLKDDVGVTLVRALLPIIIQRTELVSAIVSRMKKYVLCETTVATALPILLLLLRSSTVRAAVRSDQFSQSFATFSTQALTSMGVSTTGKTEVALEITSILSRTLSQAAETRLILYRYELQLLSSHLMSLPAISRDSYVESTKNSTILLEPLPHLIQAVSILTRLSIHASRNCSTQIVDRRDMQVARAVADVEKIVAFVLDRDIHDLEIDKLSDFSPSCAGRANLKFSYMLLSLYDVLVEHLWHVGNVLVDVEAAEKICGILRRKEELAEVLKEKLAKRKEGKAGKVSTSSPVLIQVGTVVSIMSAFIENKFASEIECNERCMRLLHSGMFSWVMEWSEQVSSRLNNYSPQPSLLLVTEFARLNLLLGCLNEKLSHGDDIFLWDGKCTQAMNAFAATVGYIVSKYENRRYAAIETLWRSVCNDAAHAEVTGSVACAFLIRFLIGSHLPKIFETYEDYAERKLCSEFTHQAISCLEASHEKVVLKEVWHILTFAARRASCKSQYIDLLMLASVQIIDLLKGNDVATQLESVCGESTELSADMVTDSCIASFADIRLVIEIISQPISQADLNASITKTLEFGKHLAEIVKILLPVYVEYAMLKDRICELLTALYSSLNSIVKLLLVQQKIVDVKQWSSVTALANLSRGSVLKIMEAADANVGTLSPLEESNLKQIRKYAKSLKDENLYVSYVRARELYQANLLLLCAALGDERLDVQVKMNSIGVRDFRIDADKLLQKMAKMEENEENEEPEESTPPKRKK